MFLLQRTICLLYRGFRYLILHLNLGYKDIEHYILLRQRIELSI